MFFIIYSLYLSPDNEVHPWRSGIFQVPNLKVLYRTVCEGLKAYVTPNDFSPVKKDRPTATDKKNRPMVLLNLFLCVGEFCQ